MDTIRKVTPKFDYEFRRWVNRTKVKNKLPLCTDMNHRYVRKVQMDLLADLMRNMPPIKIKKCSRNVKYKINIRGKSYAGIL